MPTGRMAKWQIILSEFDIIFTTQKAVKGHAIADHLAGNPIGDDYQPLHTYLPDEQILFVRTGENMHELYAGWRLFFDSASNSSGAGIGAVWCHPKGNIIPPQLSYFFSAPTIWLNTRREYLD